MKSTKWKEQLVTVIPCKKFEIMYKTCLKESKPNASPTISQTRPIDWFALRLPMLFYGYFYFGKAEGLVKSLKFRFKICVYGCCCARTVNSASQFACNTIHPEREKKRTETALLIERKCFSDSITLNWQGLKITLWTQMERETSKSIFTRKYSNNAAFAV